MHTSLEEPQRKRKVNIKISDRSLQRSIEALSLSSKPNPIKDNKQKSRTKKNQGPNLGYLQALSDFKTSLPVFYYYKRRNLAYLDELDND
jgi:hypothetical protein